MSKAQLPMPSFVGNTSSQSSPPICYPPAKADKNESQPTTLCGCRKAPRSQCMSAIGKTALKQIANKKINLVVVRHVFNNKPSNSI